MSPMKSPPLSIELGLLGYLRSGPFHGYQIHQHLQKYDGPGLVWRVKQAQLYAQLGKLAEAGYIQCSLQAQETRPTRRVYQLTEIGKEVFEQWVVTPVSTPRQIRHEFMVKLYFAQRENPQTVITLINNQLSLCQHWLAMRHEQLTTSPAGSFSHLIGQYRLGQIQATLSWLQQLKSDLSKNISSP